MAAFRHRETEELLISSTRARTYLSHQRLRLPTSHRSAAPPRLPTNSPQGASAPLGSDVDPSAMDQPTYYRAPTRNQARFNQHHQAHPGEYGQVLDSRAIAKDAPSKLLQGEVLAHLYNLYLLYVQFWSLASSHRR